MNIPRIKIANLPTPIETLPRLSAALGGVHLSIKRDDLTGIGMGGNKVRKLELLLAEALANGAKTLITTGAIQSNHCRQTAAVAAKYGLKCILVLSGDRSARVNGNLLLDELFGAEIVWTTKSLRDEMLKQTFSKAWSEGRRPYLIPYGGSSPVGALGYALAMEELAAQGSSPDVIVFATSSGGTQAGMVVGARMTGYKGRIIGISIDHPASEFVPQIVTLASAAADRAGMPTQFNPREIEVVDDYLGGGYGVFNDLENEALHLFGSTEGLLLDPVYTGRAAAGMIDLIRKGGIKQDQSVLFWHTGGTPALFAEQYADQISQL